MKILFDHQIFTQQRYGGISRYFFELITRFDQTQNICEVATLYTENAYYNKSVNSKLNRLLPSSSFKGKGRITTFLNQQMSNYKLRKGDFDVFHPTYYDDYFESCINHKPFVVTFYDMIHEKYSDKYDSLKADTKILERKRRLLDSANRIISISETTKRDIIDLFDVDSSKIDVVHLGSSLDNFKMDEEALIKEDYILFVGTRDNYKNFVFFLSSIAEILKDYKIKLICAGGGEFTAEEVALITLLDVENDVFFKKIANDNVLANYYSNALFFCFPSLYEGFGIPILEAFACNCAILSSRGGSLPEVAGDAALYFDETDSESLKKATVTLLLSESLRSDLKARGKARLQQFSWDKAFQETLDVYSKVV